LTGNQSLIARIALSAAVGIVSTIICRLPRLRVLSRESFDRIVNLTFVVSRITLYLGVFFGLHLAPRGDIKRYLEEGVAVLSHLQPYRDFASSYAPLHPYLDSFIIRVWPSALALIFIAICIEMLVLPLWLRVGRVFLAEQDVRGAALLYLTSAISLQFVTIDGQDTVTIAVLLVLSLFFIYRKHTVASGIVAGWGVVAVKFLPLLYLPAFFVAIPRRWRWLAAASVVIVLVYGYFSIRHLPIFQPVVYEGELKSAGNLPYLLEGISGLTLPSKVWDGLLIGICATIYLFIAAASRQASLPLRMRVLAFGFVALTIALTMFSKKSWPPYLILALFPICLLIGTQSRLRIAAFALFGVFAVTTESYWATDVGMEGAPAFHLGLMAHEPKCFLFLALQLGLLTGYATILLASIHQIRKSRPPIELDV
jgi:hypothetical protein